LVKSLSWRTSADGGARAERPTWSR